MNANSGDKSIVLDDIKTALISEMMSYEFYSHSSISVNLISCMHAFQDMTREEEKHVKWLKKEYEKLGGTEKIEYDHTELGGIALPVLDIDLVTALDVAIKEESSSLKMYNDFLEKHKDKYPETYSRAIEFCKNSNCTGKYEDVGHFSDMQNVSSSMRELIRGISTLEGH